MTLVWFAGTETPPLFQVTVAAFALGLVMDRLPEL